MYFDFEDYRPDTPRVGSAISWREGVLLSIILHMAGIIVLLLSPNLLRVDPAARRAQAMAVAARDNAEQPRFVFVQPRVERPAPKAPERAEPSDLDRVARAPERAAKPENALPFSRGNTPERVDEVPSRARGEGPAPEPQAAAGQPVATPPTAQPTPEQPAPSAQSGLQLPTLTQRSPAATAPGVNGRSPVGGGSLGDAVKNLQRFVQMFDNQRGGGGEFGPEIQFDTKGVEFGPWIRRFIAQVKRNWVVPYAAMSLKGHVVITFNVHKDGTITDLSVAAPSGIESFNSAAFGALSGSNPTQPLPSEYPSEKAFFTVTFFYNETPP